MATITVTGQSLQKGDEVRLRLVARDVSLTLEHQSSTSILNISPVTVDEIMQTGPAQLIVMLMADGVPILSKITRKFTAELELQAGKKVFVQVKSVVLLS